MKRASDTPPPTPGHPRISAPAFTVAALVGALLIACVLNLGASSSPDALEFVAADTGIGEKAHESVTAGSPAADYLIAGLGDSFTSVAAAGALGCLVTFGAAWLITRSTRSRI